VTRIAPPPPPSPPPPSTRRVARPASARSLEEARSLYRRSAFAEAGAIAERVVDSDRDDLGAHIFLGDIYLKRGMYEKALAQYQEALKLSPNAAAALRGRDLVRARMR
jgi:tetratricopeptide (TPR) repeat protein